MKKSRFIISFMAALVIVCMCIPALADGRIFVDGQEVISDTPSQIVNSRTMVPVRAITEMLGYDVYWTEETQQVDVCEKGSTQAVITMTINSTSAYVFKYDDATGAFVKTEATLDSPAILINSRTFVPLRFISEAVGYAVEYDEASKDVYLYSPEKIFDNYTVQQVVELYKDELLEGIKYGLAESGTNAEVDISAEHNTFLIEVFMTGVDGMTAIEKAMVQRELNSNSNSFKNGFAQVKETLLNLECVKLKMCEEDGDVIANIEIDMK